MSRLCYPIHRERIDQSSTPVSKSEQETPRKLSAKFKSVFNYIKSKTTFQAYCHKNIHQLFDGHKPCSSNHHINMNDSINSYSNDSDAIDLEQRTVRELVSDYKKELFDKNLSDMIDKILPTVRSVIMKK
jgi:hypothetical protein